MAEAVSLNLTQNQVYSLVQKAKNGSDSALDELCFGIYNATAGQLGTNKDYINKVLSSADSGTLASIMDNYSEVTGSEIYKDIENELLYTDKDNVINKLDKAYLEANGIEYTKDNDGKLTIAQTASSVGKGILNKLPSIGLLAAGTYFAPAISGAIGTGLTALVGTAAATTIATVGAPILAIAGIATAGYMIYKGVTETKEAIDKAKNSNSDEVTKEAITQGTESILNTAEGVYLGVQSTKGLYDSVKNIKNTIGKTSETTTKTEIKTQTETTNTKTPQTTTENIVPEKTATAKIDEINTSSISKSRQNINDIETTINTRKVGGSDKYTTEIIDKNGTCIGKATCYNGNANGMVNDLPDNYYTNGREYAKLQCCSFDGDIRNTLNSIYVDKLGTTGEYSGTGTKIIKNIVQQSEQLGYDGHVCLLASKTGTTGFANKLYNDTSPVPFYYKLGFRFQNETANKAVEQALETAKTTGVLDLGEYNSGIMYLPDEAIAKILGK